MKVRDAGKREEETQEMERENAGNGEGKRRKWRGENAGLVRKRKEKKM